ncbi:OmpA family protein [Reinekea sp. G2M2-21]|uniref:OmpA family protein n=1 Tax=Reinekea sp. G2M2-21 TaxID=2788942 RepID=UPI0018A9F3FA|nr:OmpA family protein [Reinekea sp. G2M2-21]
MNLQPIAAGLITLFAITGCAQKATLSDQAALQTYPTVANLKTELLAADLTNVEMLSPKHYDMANTRYEKSLTLAKTNDIASDQIAREGMKDIKQANVNANTARDVFEDVLEARDNAIEAGAKHYSSEKFTSAEKALLTLTTLLENGETDKAKAGRSRVVALYSALELSALKGDSLDKAKAAILSAQKNDVGDYAPKTMLLAQEELAIASNTLDADRNSTEKADQHAKVALYHVQRATEITEVIKRFDTSDFTSEDIVLWYQGELSDAVKPVYPDLPFDLENKVVIKSINQKVAMLATNYTAMEKNKNAVIANLTKENDALLMSTNESTASIVKEKNREIASLTAKNAALVSASSASAVKDKEVAAKFVKVQSLFTDNEADVYRKADDILINAHGFQFVSGRSEIESENFAMMDKIISAIREFPNSTIVVSGHTDSQGDGNSNKKLSQDRADKVAKFLLDVGGITSNRITAVGYGEEKPVSSNGTSAGRSSNRRVEIFINNNAAL